MVWDYWDKEKYQFQPNPYRPRVVINHVDSTRSFITFKCGLDISEEDRTGGRFLDLRTFSHALTGKKQRVFASIHYGARSWDKPRRVIVKAEHSSHGANPRVVVTNLPQTDRFLYDKVYCARGDTSPAARKTVLRTSSWTCLPNVPPLTAGGRISSGNCCRA